jgi:hypothetical protein
MLVVLSEFCHLGAVPGNMRERRRVHSAIGAGRAEPFAFMQCTTGAVGRVTI